MAENDKTVAATVARQVHVCALAGLVILSAAGTSWADITWGDSVALELDITRVARGFANSNVFQTTCLPLITEHPADQTVCEGVPVAFGVIAGGEPPLDYQWRKDARDIPGATEATFTIDAVIPEDSGEYDVVVSNTCGSDTSDPATLVVLVKCPPCDGDANGDGIVDPLDLGFVLARFGCTFPNDGINCLIADVNGDGSVDPLDAGYILARFGPCP